MNYIIGWGLVIIMLIISVILLMGKGAIVIAGYNMSSKKEKEKYNEKMLCRIVGSGLLLITILLGILVYYNYDLPQNLEWLMPYGLFAIVISTLILGKTIAKK